MRRVYKWELLKLLAQKRTYIGLGTAMIVPIVFVVVLLLQKGGPNDIPLGRYIRQTGLATPFVVLFFMSIWAFPLLTALVAGDIVAAESQNGTLKTILTRSRNRGEIYAGKVLASITYTALILLAMGSVGLLAAGLAWGFDPLTSLSGSTVSFGQGLGLLAGSLAVYLWPMTAIAAFGLMLST
ncbi:MAG: ABC transporter permease, partial [Actinobacteria bacterium]|nr:ABC transporter permease [Actinomycetota bacterium]